MTAEKLRDQFAPWSGLVIGLVGTGLVHQFGSEGVFNHCAAASPVPIVIGAVVGIAVTLVAARISWSVVRNSSEGPSRRLIGVVSVGAAALFAMTMLLPLLASLIIPPCFA